MKRLPENSILLFFMVVMAGCAPTSEFTKTVWGSSTRALEKARVNALVKVYDQSISRCYDETLKAAEKADFYVFIADKAQAKIVLMRIKGAVNTTEVGVFFSELSDGKTKVYVSSLSSNAKRIVADKLFTYLDTVLGSSSSQAVTVI